MGVYITGLKIPSSGQCVFVLTSSGMVENVNGLVVGEAVEVKVPHGDLIDKTDLDTYTIDNEIDLDDIPVVIEAEGKDEG